MSDPILADFDPNMRARILTDRSLVYEGQGVRAGSGLAWSEGKMVMVQDSSDMIAIIEGEGSSIVGLPLRSAAGDRLGAGSRGRLSLEAMIASKDYKGPYLLAFASGASSDLRSVARVRLGGGQTELSVYQTRNLYRDLAQLEGFALSNLSISGAAVIPKISGGRDAVRLFHRGHGLPSGDPLAWSSTVDLRLDPLLVYIERCIRDPDAYFGIELENPRSYDLGTIEGVPVSFTDAAGLPDGRVIFIGSAQEGWEKGEAGPCIGLALGVIDTDGKTRYTVVVEKSGAETRRGAQGLAVVSSTRAFIVLEQEGDQPSVLCELELAGI